ncbi:MAG: TrkH family potassium uptake protein [Candidatus Omnitrophica bacterium]|nr:TrkH family potassium uptake protein [Candidatus Omnitrophota bacterium]
MILRPRVEDTRTIGYYLGKVIVGLGTVMLLPMVLGLACNEFNPALDFCIGAQISLIIGILLIKLCDTDKDLSWMQGMIVVSLSWLVAMVLGAIPMFLSGHWHSFLDACFDSMSGFATTGLTLVWDLDHLALSHNFWRHLIMFVGGQGIVIVILSLLVKGTSGAFKMYIGEARDEKILPNVVNTSRFIWLVSIIYFILGTLVLGVVGITEGMPKGSAFFHGACIFMAAFDTGGFTPQSQNILYYHSAAIEMVTIVIMILGAINFRLHYHIWMGNRREITKNIETVAFFFSVSLLFVLVAIGLNQMQAYPYASMLFRKGFYQFISGHTGTGHGTLYAPQFINDWSQLALVGLIIAMALGGAVCSTTGAIKMLRVGVVMKALFQDIKRVILPDKSIVIQKFHHIRDVFLEDHQARTALIITLAYLALYGIGSLVGMLLGYPFLSSLFESTSAAANVGLSCGITQPAMPAALKITYIFQMWAGRLEFISVFTLIGFFVAAIRGK